MNFSSRLALIVIGTAAIGLAGCAQQKDAVSLRNEAQLLVNKAEFSRAEELPQCCRSSR